MTEIWMDPPELRRVAGDIARQVIVLRDTVTGVCSACACDVSRSTVAWLDAELVAITEDALRAAVGYLEQVVDIAERAVQIEADQAAAGVPVAATTAVGGVPLVGGLPGMSSFVHVPDPTVGSMTIGNGSVDPLVTLGAAVGMGSPLFGTIMDIQQTQNDMIGTILAPSGLTVEDGQFVDAGGDVGDWGDVRYDPIADENVIDP
jgi:hypothetical protein